MSDPEKNLPNEPEEPKKWYQIAEVRMLFYVIPVAIVFLIIALILS